MGTDHWNRIILARTRRKPSRHRRIVSTEFTKLQLQLQSIEQDFLLILCHRTLLAFPPQ